MMNTPMKTYFRYITAIAALSRYIALVDNHQFIKSNYRYFPRVLYRIYLK